MFEKLKNRCFIRGELVLENEMHIGSGKGDARTDSLLVKDFNGEPFIPGSSLRGNMRSVIERIAASLDINPCLLMYSTCVTNPGDIQDEFKDILKLNDDYAIIEKFLNDDSKICPVCRLFGSTVVASKIKITDLPLKNKYLFSWDKVPGNDSVRLIKFLMQDFKIEWIKAAKINKNDDGKTIRITNDTNFLSLTMNNEKNNVNLEIDDGRTNKFIVITEKGELNIYNEKAKPTIRHGVAINRDTETSQDKAKFDFEVIPKDSSFSFELIGENLTKKDCALLAIGIQEMVNGNFWIGGNSARGLGKCKLKNLEIEYFKDVNGLKLYLKDKTLTKMEDTNIFLNLVNTLLQEN